MASSLLYHSLWLRPSRLLSVSMHKLCSTFQIGRVVRPLTVGLAMVWFTSGCATWQAYQARFNQPQYLVSAEFYRTAPQRVGVLPFASRDSRPVDIKRAEICRRVFYQNFALHDFEDLEMSRFDDVILNGGESGRKRPLHTVMDIVRAIDLVGMTSLLDLHSMFSKDPIRQDEVRSLLEQANQAFKSDAYVMGISRSYGRFYAVVISSIGISTRVELRSASTGAILWRGEGKSRNVQVPISLNPIDIPYLLWYTWQNSRGVAMDMLAYRVYRDLAATIPYLKTPQPVRVVTTRPRARLFKRPSLWTWRAVRKIPQGESLEFLLEQNGWFEVRAENGEVYWVFRRDAQLRPE